jgi:hypothetical protein
MAKAEPRRNVTFELAKAEYRALQDDAAVRGLDSLHQRAREVIVDYLSHQPAEEVSERIGAVEQELAGLKEQTEHLGTLLRRVAYAVIYASTNSNEEANQWVSKNMSKNSR